MPKGFVMLVYKRPVTEADIVGELYFRLRNAGLTIRLEAQLPSLIMKSGKLRVDVAVIQDDEVKAVVEVKRKNCAFYPNPKNAKQYAINSKAAIQVRAYESFERNTGVPVLWVRGYKEIAPTIIKIKEILSETRFVTGIRGIQSELAEEVHYSISGR